MSFQKKSIQFVARVGDRVQLVMVPKEYQAGGVAQYVGQEGEVTGITESESYPVEVRFSDNVTFPLAWNELGPCKS